MVLVRYFYQAQPSLSNINRLFKPIFVTIVIVKNLMNKKIANESKRNIILLYILFFIGIIVFAYALLKIAGYALSTGWTW